MSQETPQLRVPAEALDYDGELLFTYRGEPFTGVAFEDEPGKWLSELSYSDGMQQGPARDWYPSGKLKSESWYRENTLHGFSREYNEDETVVSEDIYEYGIIIRRTRWDDAGIVTDSWHIDPAGDAFARLQRYRAAKGWPPVAR